MKDIKFRAWNFYEKKMYRLEAIDVRFELVTVTKQNSDKQDYDAYFRFSEIELMQCTDLKDKNGKEIYEGDIVSVKYIYDKRTTDRAQVVWREDKASFGLKSLKGLTNEVYELYKITAEHNLEVIGNIYENKELLNE